MDKKMIFFVGADLGTIDKPPESFLNKLPTCASAWAFSHITSGVNLKSPAPQTGLARHVVDRLEQTWGLTCARIHDHPALGAKDGTLKDG
ncbi:hypothetical protein Trco_006191 [Trichoderma cornu-damae]|uniref:Uncharacterized protein n=1 Tax=Trichoderma cornu-damae TaxID=654480 RepID=A0A9P8QGN1_9HYPO|nr:hypothetical protein Trco_006191 [Trichoderma cornu-damae]